MNLDYLIVLIYLASILALGVFTSRGISNLQQYAVANRAYPAWIVFATLSASFIGGGYTLGNAEKVFAYGLVNVFALWGFSFKEIFVAKFIAPRMGQFRDCISAGDIMFKAYGKTGKIITGVFSVMLCMGIVGAQVGAIGYVFEVFLDMPRLWGILLGCSIVIIYVTIGGMKAVVITDIVQFGILVIGIPLALIFGIASVGGTKPLIQALPTDHLTLLGQMPLLAFISLFLTFVLGETLVPPYLQRLLIGKDAKAVTRGTLWSGLFSIPFFFITGSIGLVALVLAPDLNPNLAIPFVVESVLPVGIRGLVVAAIISVVMSSADSFLNSAAVSFSNDIVKPLSSQPMPVKQELLMTKIVTFMVGVLAVYFALSIQSVLDILIYAYQFWAPIVLIPLVAALFNYRAPSRHFCVAALGGAMSMVLWNVVDPLPVEFSGIIIGATVNGLLLWVQRVGVVAEPDTLSS